MAKTTVSRSRFQVTLRDYLMILFRRKLFFLVPLCIVFFTVTAASFFLPKIYRATAIVMVQEPEILNPLDRGFTQRSPTPPPIQEELLIFRGQLLTWPNIVQLITGLGLEREIGTEMKRQEMIEEIRRNFEINVAARNIYEVSYYDRNPLKSQSAVNLMLQIFIERNLERRREDAVTAVDFIGEQLNKYEKELLKSDDALYRFKEDNIMSFPGLKENVNIERLVRYEGQLHTIDLELNERKRELDLLERQLKGEEKVVLTEAMRAVNPIVDNLFNQLTALEMELVVLLAEATEEHPRVIDLRGQIEQTQGRLNTAVQHTVGEDKSGSNPVYQRLEQRHREMQMEVERIEAAKAELEKIVEEYRQRVSTVPETERDLTRLYRDNRVNETIHSMLKQRWESSRISQVEIKEKGNEYRILAPARLPLKPSKPRKLLLSFASLAIGIMLGVGCVFMVEISDYSLHGMEDAEKALDLPVLAAVPVIVTPAQIAFRQSKRNFFVALTLSFAVCFIVGLVVGIIRAYS